MSNNFSTAPDSVFKHLDHSFDDSLHRLFELIRIKSISTDPEYASECRLCAEKIAENLADFGCDTHLYETDGHPILVAHHPHASSRVPHILFYGHYDVQPADTLDLWETPPFEPQIKTINGRDVITGRGAADDKGQIMTFVEACRAWKNVHGELPCEVTFLIEGEEECGSSSLKSFLAEHAEKIKADIALVCDTSMHDHNTPEICISLRGLLCEEIFITAAKHDLHSGEFGGIVTNPLSVLAKILSDLHDDKGSVTIPGFYDDVEPIPQELRDLWKKTAVQKFSNLDHLGIYRDQKNSLCEQAWGLPCADINGVSGGYTGKGFKTVIPAQASAKISFRLVPKQDPERLRNALHRFVTERIPKGCSVRFVNHGSSWGVRFAYNSEFFISAQKALSAEWPSATVLGGSGASIPILPDFLKFLSLETLLIGFSLSDDRIHSPNEKYDLESFRKGQRSWVRILDAFGKCEMTK